MKIKKLILIFLLFIIIDYINFIECQIETPCGNGDQVLTISYYDTTPYRNPDFNFLPSFTPPQLYYDDKAFLANTLGPDRKPVYKLGDQPFLASDIDGVPHTVIHNEDSFNSWFRANPCETYPTTIKYAYTELGDDTLLSIQCLPLDGGGFANQTVYPDDQWEIDYSQTHNYYFCGEMHFTVALVPSDIESRIFISSQNDLILYVDNNLEMAGILRSENRWEKRYGALSERREIPVDAFFCNKGQTRFSLYILVTQGFLECKYYDACGVCNGDNSTCPCTESTICEVYDELCKTCFPVECPVDNRCQLSGCSLETGCYVTNVSCWHSGSVCEETKCNVEGSIDDPLCITTPIEDCVPCGQVGCATVDKCKPMVCDNDLCIETYIDCNVTDSCLEGYCLDGFCHTIDICSTDTLTSTVSSTVLSSTLISSTTLGPITTNIISSVGPVTIETASSILSTIISSIDSSITTTSSSTTSSSTTGSSTATTGETVITQTVSITSDTIITSTTDNPIQVKCEEFSCPNHYCCYQIDKLSFSCISKYFENNCEPSLLKEFY